MAALSAGERTLAYGFATFGAFAIITQVREKTADASVGAEATRLGQWAGLGKRSQWLATAMALFLLSFAGIPLTAGFVGKFVVFRSAINEGAWPLVLVAVLASAAAAFFYVRKMPRLNLSSPRQRPRRYGDRWAPDLDERPRGRLSGLLRRDPESEERPRPSAEERERSGGGFNPLKRRQEQAEMERLRKLLGEDDDGRPATRH